jgi:hypothetical protein
LGLDNGCIATRGSAAAAQRLSIGVEVAEMRNVDELNAALRAGASNGKRAMVVLSSPIMFANSAQIAEYTKRNRIPAISPFKPFAEAGGLMSLRPGPALFLQAYGNIRQQDPQG